MTDASSSRSPGGPLQVIAYLKGRPGRVPSVSSQRSFADRLLREGRATRVFSAPSRAAAAADRERVEQLPNLMAVRAHSEDDARELLSALNEDARVADCYVAPPRYTLARSGGSKVAASVAAADRDWGMRAVGADTCSQSSAEVRIAVVDTGVDGAHPDLLAAITQYTNTTSESDRDEDGHGTHVCGIIAGRGGSPSGMSGVSNAKLLVFKGLSDPYDATAYYRALGAAIGSADVVNLSLGGIHRDRAEEDLVALARRNGVAVVAAMGNEFDAGDEPHYPAALPGVIAVGAVDKGLRHADFSNSGDHIRLVGPGVDIWSTAPLHSTRLFGSTTNYAGCDGTSMAAPFVSGTLGVMLAAGVAKDQLASVVAARWCPGQSTWTPTLGDGLVDINRSLDAARASAGDVGS